MPDSEKFECFKRRAIAENEANYGAEIRSCYGDETVEKSNKMFAGMSEEAYRKMTAWRGDSKTPKDAVKAGRKPGAPRRSIRPNTGMAQFTWPSYSEEAHGVGQRYSPTTF